MLGKIAALAVMHKTIPAGTSLFQRLLVGLAAALALSLIASLLAGALIIGTAYYAYNVLVERGLDADAAFFSVGFFVLFLFVMMLVAAVACVRSLRDLPRRILDQEAPLTHRAGNIASAFIDGLMTHKPRY